MKTEKQSFVLLKVYNMLLLHGNLKQNSRNVFLSILLQRSLILSELRL